MDGTYKLRLLLPKHLKCRKIHKNNNNNNTEISLGKDQLPA